MPAAPSKLPSPSVGARPVLRGRGRRVRLRRIVAVADVGRLPRRASPAASATPGRFSSNAVLEAMEPPAS